MNDSRGCARVTDRFERSIGYRLNILGVRVWADRCQLVARDAQGLWTPFGSPRQLPLLIPDDKLDLDSDTLLLTALQYQSEFPRSDLREVLAQRKSFDLALHEDSAS